MKAGVGEGTEVCFPNHNSIVKNNENFQTGGAFIIIWYADPIPLLYGKRKRRCQHFKTFCVSISFYSISVDMVSHCFFCLNSEFCSFLLPLGL